MKATREQLIADWRDRPAAAEAVPAGERKRLAWLARVRIRLYRFLLSLYGEGEWQGASDSAAASPRHQSDSSVVFDSAGALPLAGKPAKSDGDIRHVLKSVANAQNELRKGPWANGLADSEWVVVLAPGSEVDPALVVPLLNRYRFVHRKAESNQGVFILTPAAIAQRVQALINRNAWWLTIRPAPTPAAPLPPASFWLLISITFAPILAVLSLLVAASRYPNAVAKNEVSELLLYAAAIFAGSAAFFFVRPISRLVLILERSVTRALTPLYRMCIPNRRAKAYREMDP